MIADNRLTEIAIWDDRLLAESLRDLSCVHLDFDLELTGFESAEIDLRIANLISAAEPSPPPANFDGPVITKPGDLWVLGEHRLFCGDALKEASYQKLLEDEKAEVVFADPPYNVPIGGHASGHGMSRHRDFAMAVGEMTPGEFTSFLRDAFHLMAKYSIDGSIHYVCMDWRHLEQVSSAGRQVYSELKNLCVWAKNVAGMGSFYRSQHELIFVFKNDLSKHQNHMQLGRFGRSCSDVWTYPSANTFSRGGEEGNLLAVHPTVKSVSLVADVLMDCSKRGEIVLDPFLGSGSSLIAAERTGRRRRGSEFDPRYVDAAIWRWQ